MISYQFSRREKVLLLILAVIAVVIAWYLLVFQNTTNQITALESQIANVESEIQIDSVRVSQLATMRQAIEEHKAAGDEPVTVPAYDNLQPLMAELNAVMGMADTYSLSFDQLADDGGEFVQRGVRIDYGCESYATAEAVINALAEGAYPCSIDTVTIVDNNARRSGTAGAGSSTVNASIHVTFYEQR